MPADKQQLENKGTRSQPNPGEAAVQPSGYNGGNPSSAGPGHTGVHSGTPENSAGHINPSAPEDSNTTPGSGADK